MINACNCGDFLCFRANLKLLQCHKYLTVQRLPYTCQILVHFLNVFKVKDVGKYPVSMRWLSVVCIQLPQMIIAVSKAHRVAMQPPGCPSPTEEASSGHQPVRGRLKIW